MFSQWNSATMFPACRFAPHLNNFTMKNNKLRTQTLYHLDQYQRTLEMVHILTARRTDHFRYFAVAQHHLNVLRALLSAHFHRVLLASRSTSPKDDAGLATSYLSMSDIDESKTYNHWNRMYMLRCYKKLLRGQKETFGEKKTCR